MNLFDTIMANCPFLKEVIEKKISNEVATRDQEIATLKATVDDLTATILMGGM